MNKMSLVVWIFMLTTLFVESKSPSTAYTACIRALCGESYNYKQKWYQNCVNESYEKCSYLL